MEECAGKSEGQSAEGRSCGLKSALLPALRARRNMEHHDATVRVVYSLDIHAKAERLEKFSRHADRIVHRGSANDRARRFVRDAQQHLSATFVGEGDAILAEFAEVELRLGFLKFQALMFGRGTAPQIDLFECGAHARPFSSSSSRPSASFSTARMSARISARVRSGCGW